MCLDETFRIEGQRRDCYDKSRALLNLCFQLSVVGGRRGKAEMLMEISSLKMSLTLPAVTLSDEEVCQEPPEVPSATPPPMNSSSSTFAGAIRVVLSCPFPPADRTLRPASALQRGTFVRGQCTEAEMWSVSADRERPGTGRYLPQGKSPDIQDIARTGRKLQTELLLKAESESSL